MEVVNNPEDPSAGTRRVPFSGVLWIEREDFAEDPPPKFFRLAPGREVRLRAAYFVTCTEVVKDAPGGSSSSAARTTRRPAAATRRTGAGRRRRSTGCRRRTRFRPRSGSTTTCSAGRTRARTATCSPTSTRLGGRRPRVRRALAGGRGSGETVQFERLGYFCAGPGLAAGRAGLQPDADAQGHLGEGAGEGLASLVRGRQPAACSMGMADESEADVESPMMVSWTRRRPEPSRSCSPISRAARVSGSSSRTPCSLPSAVTTRSCGTRSRRPAAPWSRPPATG